MGGPGRCLEQSAQVRVGVAAHSVRAVARSSTVAGAAAEGGPMHIHVSEQPAENDACRGFYLCTPTELLETRAPSGDGSPPCTGPT